MVNKTLKQTECGRNTKYRAPDIFGPLKSEKGIALIMNLILAAIMLVVMLGLIYMITSGTQVSGMQKRYTTAVEAARGGGDITTMFIGLKGSLTSDLINITPTFTNPVACAGTNLMGTAFTGWSAKINTPSSSWSASCNSQIAINPNDSSTYDMTFTLGGSPYPVYTVYSKIVNTIEGNTGGDEGLVGKGVVSPGEIQVMAQSYFYKIEVEADSPANPAERSKFSVLYQY